MAFSSSSRQSLQRMMVPGGYSKPVSPHSVKPALQPGQFVEDFADPARLGVLVLFAELARPLMGGLGEHAAVGRGQCGS